MLKLVFFYNQYQSGFSETYYVAGTDPKAFADTITERFMQNAVTFRSPTTFLKGIRVTRIEKPRYSFLKRPASIKQGANVYGTGNGPDVVSTDAVVVLQGALGVTRRVFIRGLNDQDVTRDAFGNDILSNNLQNGIKVFVAGMISYAFQIRFVSRPPQVGLVWQNVANIQLQLTNPYNSEFTCNPDFAGYAKNDMVSFQGIPGNTLPKFPRSAQILGVRLAGGAHFYAIPYALPGGISVNPKSMQVTPLVYQYGAIDSWAFERYSEHKTGRPFGALRGRSKAIKLAH